MKIFAGLSDLISSTEGIETFMKIKLLIFKIPASPSAASVHSAPASASVSWTLAPFLHVLYL